MSRRATEYPGSSVAQARADTIAGMHRVHTALVLVAVHAAVIALPLVYIVGSVSGPVIGANIGLGLGMLGLAAFALPWSAIYLTGAAGEVRDLGEVALFASLALLNLVLHAGCWARRLRRTAL